MAGLVRLRAFGSSALSLGMRYKAGKATTSPLLRSLHPRHPTALKCTALLQGITSHASALPAVSTRPLHCSAVMATKEKIQERSGYLAWCHNLVREALADKGQLVLGYKAQHCLYQQKAEVENIEKNFETLRKQNKGDMSAVTVYLTGPPACGKTQTARQFAERFYYKNRRFCRNKLVVATLNAADQRSLLHSFDELAAELGCVPQSYEYKEHPISEEQQLKYYSDAVKKELRRRPGWLLVIDNLGTPQTTLTSDTNRYNNNNPHHEWRHLWPEPGDESWGKGHVLITTYDRQLVQEYSSFVKEHSMKLDGMPVKDAVGFLKQISGCDRPGAEKVVNSPHIKRKPPLIVSAGLYIKDKRDRDDTYSYEDYMKELKQEGGERGEGRESEKIDYYPYPYHTRPVMNMAVKRLASQFQELHKVFILLANCGEPPVPMSIVKRLLGVGDKQGMKPEVEKCSLLNFHCEKGLPCLSHYRGYRDSFHKLLSDPVDVEVRDRILNSIVDSVVAEYKEADEISTVESYQMKRLLLPLMEHLLDPKPEFSMDATREVLLCTALADAYRLHRKANESETVLLRALDMCDKGPGKDSIEAARVYEELGETYRHMNELEDSEKMFTKAVTILETRCGKDSVEVAGVLGNRGSTLQQMGKYSESKNDLERAIAIFKGNSKSESLAVAYTILSTTLQSLGDVKGSRKMFEGAHELQKDFNSPSVAVTLNHLGIAYLDVGDPTKGVEMLEEALKINKQFHGEDHSSVAITLSNLCRAHTRLGNIEKSKRYAQQAWEKAEAIHGQNHPEVARARAILGNAYRITGDFHSAVLQLEQSVDIYKAVKGVQHADTANAQILLGKAQRLAGQLGKSQRTLNEALKTQQEVLGKNHHDTRATQDALGRLYRDMGYLTYSLQAFQMAQDIGKESYSSNPDHPKLASTMCEYARALRKAGKKQKAIETMKEALEMFRCSFDRHYDGYNKSHPNYPGMLAIMGVMLRYVEEPKESMDYLEEALDIQKDIFPTENMMKAQTIYNLGIAHHRLGDKEKALEKVQEALEMMKSIQREHYKVASILTARAILRDSKGDHKGAHDDLHEALNIRCKRYEDKNHPDIALNCRLLAENVDKHTSMNLERRRAKMYWHQAKSTYDFLCKREEELSKVSGIEIPVIMDWKAAIKDLETSM